ncbi:hypothetical protein PoB_004803700 [Plakobranchus ocellatus]|uniref:Uncharacterized protein n=1 Tax=Plakobranchus ocellatus TaxID=259542 RepID=A0AAV4BQ87_9GAST|nr:hypothetical protein PoB_004803700 [Plakobranchus ocellatus]
MLVRQVEAYDRCHVINLDTRGRKISMFLDESDWGSELIQKEAVSGFHAHAPYVCKNFAMALAAATVTSGRLTETSPERS